MSCGEISDVEKFHIRKNIIHTTVRSVLLPCMLFCCELIFFEIYAVLSHFTQFLCGEKLGPKFCLWRKKDKYQVCMKATSIPEAGQISVKNLEEKIAKCFLYWPYCKVCPELIVIRGGTVSWRQ